MSVTGYNFGDPSCALLRFAWQAASNVPPLTGWHDLEQKGETLANKSASLERQAITRAGEAAAALTGKFDSGGDPSWDAPNPDEICYPIAAMFGASASPATVETGAYLHKISRRETAVTFPPWFSLMAWRNDGMAERFADQLMASLEFTFAEKALLNVTAKTVAARGDYWDDSVHQGAGTGTAVPILRGVSPHNFDTSATVNNIWVELTAAATGTVTIKVHVGDATTYAGAAQVITRGVWTQIRDHADALLGDNANPIEIYFPTSGSVDFATPDEWKFLWRRGEWVPSYAPPAQVCNEVYSRVYVDGIETELQSGKLMITKPAMAMHGFGRAAARRTRSRGSQKVNLTFSREYLDLKVRTLIELGHPFAFVLDLQSNQGLGTTGNLRFGLKFTGLNFIPIGNTPASATSKDKSDESMSADAAPSSDGTYPAALTCEVLNSIPDLSI